MKPLTLLIVLLLLLSSGIYSQADRRSNEDLNNYNDRKYDKSAYVQDVPEELNTVDYKITASNSSYIEIEFYPSYTRPSVVNYKNESFKSLNFMNGMSHGIDKAGSPDLKFRSFPVIVPSENNTVSVVEFDVNVVYNINLSPIPNISYKDPMTFRFDKVDMTFEKDASQYSQNTFLPQNIAVISNPGTVRELLLSSLEIYPYQYNPLAKILKQYTRIKVRVTFGQAPVMINRIRTSAEYEFLKDVAVNTDVALNWMNPVLSSRRSQLIQSAMREGDWYRVEIRDNHDGMSEGIYKINKQSLEAAGINLNGLDPRNLKMYGNGGFLLPENPVSERPEDLQQIAIHIEGESDGTFDNQDYILFYASSVNNWSVNPNNQYESHFLNYYTKSNIYWIQTGGTGTSKRMPLVPSANSGNPENIYTFTDHLFFESEVRNLILEGNLWLSQSVRNGGSIQWNTPLHGLVPNTDVYYKLGLASRVFEGYNNRFEIWDRKSNVSQLIFPMGNVLSYGFDNWIYPATASFVINSNQKTSNELALDAVFQTNQPDGEGFLDWAEVHWIRDLNSPQNDYIRFYSPDNAAGIFQYSIQPFSSSQIRIFNISSHNDVAMIQPLELANNKVRFQVEQTASEVKSFIAIGENGYKTPTTISQKVPNQNLHGYADGADVIIVSYKDFLPAANRLKQKREALDPSDPAYFKCHIVEVDQIMNEFGGGVYDATAIRDYLKYAFENWTRKPVYTVFMGDGSLDYKGLIAQGKNFVPVWERTDPAINQVNGYTSDDYFVQFFGLIGIDNPDMSIGRIPAQSLEECMIFLDKLDAYENPVNNGYWKNRMSFVADDGKTTGGNDGSQHTDQVEQLAELHVPTIYEKNKLYLISYPTVITSQGRRKPECNADIIKYWNNGQIMVNYTGHGSPEVWAHEYVFEIDVALSQLKNKDRYPFLTVASCDFSKMDNPLNQSGGEKIVLAPNRGAIGSLAASRPVYGGQNAIFNNRFWSELLGARDTLRLPRTFGKATFNTKQYHPYVNDIKFMLLTDPTLRIQTPRFQSRIDSISGLSNDTMRALSRIKIHGSIIRPDSSFWSDYNGSTFIKIFDVRRNVILKDEDGIEFRFAVNGGIIYSGTQTVTNGLWTAEYIVPKDISYQNKNGRLINYFYNNQADGHGEDTRFIVGGIDPNAPVDTTGPDIKLFINNRNFRSGDVVNSSFKFIADLFDESGINTTGTIGHKLEVILDNDENKKYDVTAFYNSDSTYKSGTIEFDFVNLPEGKHTLKLRAWDTYNNSSTAVIDLEISNYSGLQVMNVFNYPNPFADKTTFTFMHNFPDMVNVNIKVYTVSGRLIKETTQQGIPDKFVAINWDGRDEDGEILGNGVYIYKLTVDALDGSSVTTTGKIAVLK